MMADVAGNRARVRQIGDVQAAAQEIGQQLIILDVSSDRDIETAFATLVQRGAGALLVGTGAFFVLSGYHKLTNAKRRATLVDTLQAAGLSALAAAGC